MWGDGGESLDLRIASVEFCHCFWLLVTITPSTIRAREVTVQDSVDKMHEKDSEDSANKMHEKNSKASITS